MKPRAHFLAMVCLCALATPGHANQFNTALVELREGRPTVGAAIFHDLARTGDADAMFNLAVLYEKGLGLPQSSEIALYWAWRARLARHPKGKLLVDQLLQSATKETRKRVLDRLLAELRATIHQQAPLSFVQLALVEEGLSTKPDQVEIYANAAMAVALGFTAAVTLRDQAGARLSTKDTGKAEARLAEIYSSWCTAQSVGPIVCPANSGDAAAEN